jgi:hypothetical protein
MEVNVIPGYTPFLFNPSATVATVATLHKGNSSNLSNSSTAPQNIYDAETVLERAAIMEFDGGLPRGDAEAMASAEADARRPQGTATEAAAWCNYILEWYPATPGDLPETTADG